MPYYRIYQEEPTLDGGPNRQRPRTGRNWSQGILPICNQRSSRRRPEISTSEPSGRSISCDLGTETDREVDKTYLNVLNKEEQKIPLHELKVKRGSMGIIVSPFQGAQSSAKDTPGRVILRESLALLGSAHNRMAATHRYNAEILFSGFIHTKKGTRPTKSHQTPAYSFLMQPLCKQTQEQALHFATSDGLALITRSVWLSHLRSWWMH